MKIETKIRYVNNSNKEWIEIDRDKILEVEKFHRSMNMPLPISILPTKYGIDILDESNCMGLNSFKILGVSYAIFKLFQKIDYRIKDYESLLKYAIRSNQRICTASDGNFGVAMAHICNLLCITCKIFLPYDTPLYYIDKIRETNADIVLVLGNYDECVLEAIKYGKLYKMLVFLDTAVPRLYESEIPLNIIYGYSTMFLGVKKRYDYIFVPSGVGGLLASTVLFCSSNQQKVVPKIISVEPKMYNAVQQSILNDSIVKVDGGDTIINGLKCGQVSSAAWSYIRRGIECAMVISDQECKEAYRKLKKLHIDTGYTGAASFAGALKYLSDIGCNEKNILVINTERSDFGE